MDLDSAHAAVLLMACSSYDPPKNEVNAAATLAGLDWLSLEDGSIDLDVPIPLILKVDAWSHFALPSGGRLLVELWGEAYDRSYGARVRLLGKPEKLFYCSPRDEGEPDWPRCVALLSEHVGREVDADALMRVLGSAWPEPLAEVWQALVKRF